MDIARHLALIDELCFRPFPAEHGPEGEGERVPGGFAVVLASSQDLCTRDPAERAPTVGEYETHRDALREHLAGRWGETDPWNLQTVLLRTEREEIPEPWAGLCAHARMAHLWAVEGTGRWVALAVADRDPADEVRLLAVVTEIDPP
ncbi:hypothetical protein [Streptomyces sp. SID8352]|uniref:hypothetical protein n=1 Tax=Streptomyces sp. SID8352 TaxID=2690338 RepID=UPI00136F40A8|nr:hypothetical protein [Streptomyces sp. SID8352]MYU23101.1 hypothetical protein [Streptomyces sp. SID8352]